MADMDDHAGTHAQIFTPPRQFSKPKHSKKRMPAETAANTTSPGNGTLDQWKGSAKNGTGLRRCPARHHMAGDGKQSRQDCDPNGGSLIIGSALTERVSQKLATVELMQRLALRELETTPTAAAAAHTLKPKSRIRPQAPPFAAVIVRTGAADTPPTTNCVAKLEWSALTDIRLDSPTHVTSSEFAAADAKAVKETWKQLRAELQLTKSARIYNPKPATSPSRIRW